ncbi:fimbrial biogenesis chaperone [Vibrio astriarenae]
MERITRLLILISLSLNAQAFQVEPMVHNLLSFGNKSQATYRLSNPSSIEAAVEATVYIRKIDAAGNEELTPSNDDFIIMPPIASIPPGSSQLFRVRYLGEPQLHKSLSYRIIFNQLPIQEEKDGITILYSFGTLVFVSPENVQPELEASIDSNKLTIKNTGNGFADLSTLESVSLQGLNQNYSYSWAEIADYAGLNFLISGQSTTIDLSLFKELNEPITRAYLE